MTPECVAELVHLESQLSDLDVPDFEDLSVEQLLLAAIMGAGLETVQHVLSNTDWNQYISLKSMMDAHKHAKAN